MYSIRIPLIALLLAGSVHPITAVTLTQFNVASTEDFDTLALVTSSVVPAGWEFSETGSGANTTYGAGTGSSATGNTYSFGATSGSDRAFGSVRTSSVSSALGTVLTNQTGDLLTDLAVQYVGEQWRLGATGRVDRLDFAYSLDATSLMTGAWLDLDALDFVALVTTGATGALDGNAGESRMLISYTITGLAVAPGSSLWLRWSDFEASGSDDGLALDHVAITAVRAVVGPVVPAVPEELPLGVIAPFFCAVLAAGSLQGRQKSC